MERCGTDTGIPLGYHLICKTGSKKKSELAGHLFCFFNRGVSLLFRCFRPAGKCRRNDHRANVGQSDIAQYKLYIFFLKVKCLCWSSHRIIAAAGISYEDGLTCNQSLVVAR